MERHRIAASTARSQLIRSTSMTNNGTKHQLTEVSRWSERALWLARWRRGRATAGGMYVEGRREDGRRGVKRVEALWAFETARMVT